MNPALAAAVSAIVDTLRSPLTVTREFGPAGAGSASNPFHVKVREQPGAEYVIKCPHLSREPHPYLCANEWIAGLLAVQVDLPTLRMAAINYRGTLATGWQRLQDAQWASLATAGEILEAAENAEMLYEMVVFDALVRNIDRHARNITARRVNPRARVYHLFVYDHDRALLPPGVTPLTISDVRFQTLDDPRLWIREQAVQRRIASRSLLFAAVEKVRRACPVEAIQAIVDSTPEEWLPLSEREAVASFLIQRANDLEEIIRQRAATILPGLS